MAVLMTRYVFRKSCVRSSIIFLPTGLFLSVPLPFLPSLPSLPSDCSFFLITWCLLFWPKRLLSDLSSWLSISRMCAFPNECCVSMRTRTFFRLWLWTRIIYVQQASHTFSYKLHQSGKQAEKLHYFTCVAVFFCPQVNFVIVNFHSFNSDHVYISKSSCSGGWPCCCLVI